jgi:hypothetical protein
VVPYRLSQNGNALQLIDALDEAAILQQQEQAIQGEISALFLFLLL